MNCNHRMNVKKYLNRFDKILCQMATKMLSAEIVNNITLDFIRCMIPHHQAAIYMCENLLEYTEYEPLEKIAKDIIRTQTRGIKQMQEIARTTSGFSSSPSDVECYMKRYRQITKNMICKMKNSPRSANINLNFTNEMIPHHEGAVLMCENLLKYCIDPRLKSVAQTIIKEQSEGIEQLEEIRKNLCERSKKSN